jgi:Arc/MetJ family transcription regulator
MPTPQHEGLLQLFEHWPVLATLCHANQPGGAATGHTAFAAAGPSGPRRPDAPTGVLAGYTFLRYFGVWGGGTIVSRTNIVLDDKLVAEVMRLTNARTKREAVDLALRRLVEQDQLYAALRKLKGRLPWSGDVEAWRRRA